MKRTLVKRNLCILIILLLTAVGCEEEETRPALEMPSIPLPDTPVAATAVNEDAGGAQLQPTPTIAPTITPTTAPEATAVPAATTSPVTEGLPAISSDLLFIADGALKWWRHDLGQIETLMMGGTAVSSESSPSERAYTPVVGDVTALVINDDGSQAIIAKLTDEIPFIPDPENPYTDTIGVYQIIRFDFNSGEQVMMFPTLFSRYTPVLSISPDGQRMTVGGLGTHTFEELNLITDGGLLSGNLYIRDTAVGAAPKIIDRCEGTCRGIAWHMDNNLFVYGNQDGLKLYNISASAPELLIDGAIDNTQLYRKFFSPISWANNGRFLLMQYSEYIEGSERAVFDIISRQLMIVPNSGAYVGPYAHVDWMNDARLFLVRQNESYQAIGETLRVDVDSGQLTVDETVQLSQGGIYPVAPKHWADGRFGYALFNVHSDMIQGIDGSSSGLYQRVSFNEEAVRLNDLPALNEFYTSAEWNADGSSFVVSDLGTMWYISGTGGVVQNMTTAVGLSAHSFNWIK